MWAAGAVCFFAAWGRTGAEEASMQNVGAAFSFNLIAGLIAIMVLGDILIVNPVIRLAGGKRAFDTQDKKPLMFFLDGFLHVIKVMALVLLIVQTYYFLNVLCIRMFKMDESAVPVPLEPFLFGILYGFYYLIIDTAGKWFTGKSRLRSAESFNLIGRSRGMDRS
jgi:hypothetical protein